MPPQACRAACEAGDKQARCILLPRLPDTSLIRKDGSMQTTARAPVRARCPELRLLPATSTQQSESSAPSACSVTTWLRPGKRPPCLHQSRVSKHGVKGRRVHVHAQLLITGPGRRTRGAPRLCTPLSLRLSVTPCRARRSPCGWQCWAARPAAGRPHAAGRRTACHAFHIRVAVAVCLALYCSHDSQRLLWLHRAPSWKALQPSARVLGGPKVGGLNRRQCQSTQCARIACKVQMAVISVRPGRSALLLERPRPCMPFRAGVQARTARRVGVSASLYDAGRSAQVLSRLHPC